MKQVGKLIAIGGSEERGPGEERYEVLERVIREAKGADTHIEVITTASGIPRQIGKEYQKAFDKIGVRTFGLIHVRNAKEASDKKYLQRIEQADVVMFSGGDQNKLSNVYGGTTFLSILKERLATEKQFVIAGTSAGAMAQSEKMINGGTPADAVRRGKAMMMEGLGFLDSVIIDSHFVNRGRFGRLMVAVAEHPELVGIGISEDTAVLFKPDATCEIFGSGEVVVMDAREMGYNSLKHAGDHLLNLEHMVFHLFSHGAAYDIAGAHLL